MKIFISFLILAVASIAAVADNITGSTNTVSFSMPSYLKGYETLWKNNPHAAALAWFKNAHFGMFIHFSPASGRNFENPSWSKLNSLRNTNKLNEIQEDEFARSFFEPTLLDPAARTLMEEFRGNRFNADEIADLAADCGMKYIIFTVRHVFGRLYLCDTTTSDWCSTKMGPKRDFLAEMAAACRKRGLGLVLYVACPVTMPVTRDRYQTLLTELLTKYGPIAGIWFDGIGQAYRYPEDYANLAATHYALIHKLQPQCLIAFKTGFTGDEDFLAPEMGWCSYDKNNRLVLNNPFLTSSFHKAPKLKTVWDKMRDEKKVEICATINGWFYAGSKNGKSAEQILGEYQHAQKVGANYVLNLPPRYDGSLDPAHVALLKRLGAQIKSKAKN